MVLIGISSWCLDRVDERVHALLTHAATGM